MNKIDIQTIRATGEQSKAQRLTGVAVALGLLVIAVWMLATFLPALAWAVVLAIATWPLFVVARDHTGQTWAAAAMTVLIAAAVLGPLTFAVIEAGREIADIAQKLIETRQGGFEAPQWVADLPFVGAWLADWLNDHLQGERNFFEGTDFRALGRSGLVIGRQAARRIITLLFALLIVFFVFRHSDTLLRQCKVVGNHLLGSPAQRFGVVAAQAVRGTVDGLLMVGIGEGVLIGIAYVLAGVPHPALLGAVTGLFAAVPFAAPVVFIGAGVWLLTQSHTIAAAALVVFGATVMFIADHFVRPALIGGTTRLPFVWVLLGIFGGLESFGLLGLFVGPALLTVLVTLWRELAAPPDDER